MTDYTSYTDEELVEKIHNGGEDRITEYILEKYKPLVRKGTNALYLIGGEQEDLIQEGMIGLFKAVRDFRNDRDSSFFGFAQLCINRQLYSALEASNRKKHQPLNTYVSFSGEEGKSMLEGFTSSEIRSPEQLILEEEKFQEFQEQLKQKLSKMEEKVLSYYLEGNNYIQIADIMGKSPKSIDNALQRIRQKIKRK